MPFSRRTLEEKPYNRCLNCVHIGKMCDGPNFLAMEIERWCEWCRLRKEYLGWTSAHLAEIANVSKVSVDRIMRIDVKDLRISTMQAVTKALVNGTWGQYPCVFVATGNATTSTEECQKLNDEVTRLKAEIETLRTDSEKKIAFLREQVQAKDRLLESISHFFDSGRK